MPDSGRRADLRAARQDRTLDVDRCVRASYSALVPSGGDARIGSGVAVVAVGGYGRGELTPFGDVDVVLVHDDTVPTTEIDRIAEGLWYPLWDQGLKLDHAVRSASGMREAARSDFKVAMGWLDARTVAGDTGLVLRLRSEVLADWRAGARTTVEEVRLDRSRREQRAGWLAYVAVPDLKESAGGLRDAVVLRGLVATWLVDAPLGEVEALRSELLDVRDVLHAVSGRATDRLDPQLAEDVAVEMGMSRAELQVMVRDAGRRLDHVGRLTWRRLQQTLSLSASRSPRDVGRTVQLVPGVGRDGDEVAGEIVLTAGADASDPVLALRAAAVAARAGLPLSPTTAAALAAAAPVAADAPPWDGPARRALVDLLTAGPGLVDVWHELDVVGLVDHWLPEWADLRLRGSSSPVHRYTIDRHSIETCVQAGAHLRTVDRPDLLAVASLLHDIGKGREGDHSEVGEPMAREIVLRWGFPEADADVVAALVRWHLLLPTVATRRDIEDPATALNVAEIVRTESFLDLLSALSRADGAATSSEARSRWRRGLIDGLVEKVRASLAGEGDADADASYEGWPDQLPFPSLDGVDGVRVEVAEHQGGSLLTIVAPDAAGLLARLAGALALAGIDLHSLRTVTRDGFAVSMWETPRTDVDRQIVADRVRHVLSGGVDLDLRLDRPAKGDDDPRVRLMARANLTATMLEVRALDRRGLIYLVARAVHAAGGSIRSAHVSTFGAEVRDVFYVVDDAGDPLDLTASERVREAVAGALA
ncbi:[protein-PII] uridylyltransferase [Aeromicrobium alkaliterrae]|uniref:Bifunctional uridylyltransferase/uridylyl-removing enzyme n=1 Tax=Aeromicrobium alkaliterrae TaxID=302168 RepID=A0ABN2JMG4_9ACTN